MSATARRRMAIVVAAAVVVLAVIAIGPRRGFGAPLDPDSTGPLGVRGLVDVMIELGFDIRVEAGVPGPADQRALVIVDAMTDGQRDGVREWVRDGGTLVLADPLSDLAPSIGGLTSIAFTEPTIEPECEDPAVRGVNRVSVADGFVFDGDGIGTSCFPRNDGAWMVRASEGQGQIVSLGGPLTLTNQLLDDADNAVLLVNLLAPTDGGGVMVIRGEDPAGGGEDSLAEVLPDQVWLALAQIPLAWLGLVWWRGRRHGKPVLEDPPVRVDAAETTIAVGNLMRRAGQAQAAAQVLRWRLTHDLRLRLGIPDTIVGDTLVAVVVERTRLPADRLRDLLVHPLPTTDDGLTGYARDVALLQRHLITHRPGGPPTDAPVPSQSQPQPIPSRSPTP